MNSPTFQPIIPVEENIDLTDLRNRLQEVYPTASSRLIVTAIEACQLELASESGDPERLIRCVRERMTA